MAASGLVVQARVPAGLPAPTARVIELAELVTVLPDWSSTVTAGWLVQVAPLAPPPGWAVKTSWVAVPKVMVKALLVAAVSPVAAAVSVYGARLAGDLAAGEGGHAVGGGQRVAAGAGEGPRRAAGRRRRG